MGEKTKDFTLADLAKLIQDSNRKNDDRFDELESRLVSRSTEADESIGDESEEVDVEETAPPARGIDSFYGGYNPATGLHDLAPKIGKLVDTKLKRMEERQEKRELIKDKKANEEKAITWLRRQKDYSKELERDIAKELKQSQLGRMDATAAVFQAYQNVTGVKVDRYGTVIETKTKEPTVKEAGVNLSETSKIETNGEFSPESIGNMSDENFAEMDKSGKLKENWNSVVGAR